MPRARLARPVLLLGPGASGGPAAMQPWAEALAHEDVEGVPVKLPRGRAERAVPAYERALDGHPGAAIGGHSFGGRVASLVAAERPVPALVLLSYPLHRPGHPEELRTGHWEQIRCPVLALSGERDPFARIDLLRREAARIRDLELVTFPGLGHGLLPASAEVAERIAAFLDERLAGA